MHLVSTVELEGKKKQAFKNQLTNLLQVIVHSPCVKIFELLMEKDFDQSFKTFKVELQQNITVIERRVVRTYNIRLEYHF